MLRTSCMVRSSTVSKHAKTVFPAALVRIINVRRLRVWQRVRPDAVCPLSLYKRKNVCLAVDFHKCSLLRNTQESLNASRKYIKFANYLAHAVFMCEFCTLNHAPDAPSVSARSAGDAGNSAGAVTAPGCATENAVCQACIDVNEALPYWNGASCGHER